jgi:dipeptidase E
MELLLLSNSTLPEEAFFQWPRSYVASFLQGKKRVGFVPFALHEDQHDAYVDKVAPIFAEMGCETIGLHNATDAKKAVDDVDVIAVGGGNSFLLLRSLYRSGLIRAIGDRVKNGLPYMGWSAGANVACPTIMTTNDMPIVEPPSFKALHLVPFQINPHYTEATIPGHGGESRDQRIHEYLAQHPKGVVAGLREGALLHVSQGRMELHGKGMKIFRAGQGAVEIPGGTTLRRDLSES